MSAPATSTLLHEASHTCAAFAYDFLVDIVSVVRDGSTLGYVQFVPTKPSCAFERIVVALAGAAATARHAGIDLKNNVKATPYILERCSSTDLKIFQKGCSGLQITSNIHRSPEIDAFIKDQHTRDIHAAIRESCLFVNENWEKIVFVSHALELQNEMTGLQVLDCIELFEFETEMRAQFRREA